jgi:hypothetical protein
MDGEILLNVTGNAVTLRERNPPHLPVLLKSLGSPKVIVRGFTTIDPKADNDEATYPHYPDFSTLIGEHVGEWAPS